MSSRFQEAKSIAIECIDDQELELLMRTKDNPTCYDGFEPSSRIHIAQGISKILAFNKLTKIGVKCTIWLADWFAQLNDKLGGDLDIIRKAGQYMIHVWHAGGLSPDVEFLFASEEINKRPDEYWSIVMDVARHNSINRMMRCCQIMGRKESYEMSAAQIMYAAMQVADIFFLDVDICQLGLDQRKVNMLSREYAETTGRKKPIALSHLMLPGLLEGQEKMAKSNPSGAIYMDDDPAQIRNKIKQAYCPPKIIEANPCISYVVNLVMPWFDSFDVRRPDKFGGNATYKTPDELYADYSDGRLHPMDLKTSLSSHLIKILQPIQDHLKHNKEAQMLKAAIDAHLNK